jgi:hypothetical protein
MKQGTKKEMKKAEERGKKKENLSQKVKYYIRAKEAKKAPQVNID